MKNCYKINNYSGIIIIDRNKDCEFIIDTPKRMIFLNMIVGVFFWWDVRDAS